MIATMSEELKKYLDTSKMYDWRLKPNAPNKVKKEWENIQKEENQQLIDVVKISRK